MGRREDCGGNALAAAEIAPCQTISPGGRLDPGDERHMIEPSRRQHRFEVPQIRNIGPITVIFSRHCLWISPRSVRRPHTTCRGPLIIINRTALGQVNGNYNAPVEQSGNNCYIRLCNDSVAASTPVEEGRWQKSR